MHDDRFLIIGADGQLGQALRARFPKAQAVNRGTLDITDWQALTEFDWSNVDTVFNAAAYTNVDGAETPEGRQAAWQINAQAVGYLAKLATQHDLTLIHPSSEYVFDGTQSPHLETEPFTPLGVYAQSKAAGDIAATVAAKHYILRVSWLIGNGSNFVRTMVGLAAKNISPTVVADQVGRLTFTETLVDGIDKLLRSKAPYGTYNLSNDGEPASWADITRLIFQYLDRNDLRVTDTTTTDYFAAKPTAAPRPLRSTLDLSKIKAIGVRPTDWREALRHYIEQEQTR